MLQLLLLTPQLPYPPRQGASLRNFNIIQGLSGQYELTLLSYLEPGQTADPHTIEPLLKLCAVVQTVPLTPRPGWLRLAQMLFSRQPDMAHRLNRPEFAAALRQLLRDNQFDIVQIEGIELAPFIRIVKELLPQSKIIFDDHNAEAELQRRAFLTDLGTPRRWPAAFYSWVQARRLRRFERWACETADGVTAVSALDAKLLQELVPGLAVTAIPNCIDVEQYSQPGETPIPFDLVFIGKMDYRPNIDAMLWFAQEIWPMIVERRPETTLAVVGQQPHARLAPLRALPNVAITGQVESVRPYLDGASVFIMPFRLGSGTRLKLIEAMAAGKAIVATPSGAEGFPLYNDKELLLATQPADFALSVLHLLGQPSERERLGQNARQFAAQYDWRVVIPRFTAVYDAAVGERRN
jgi:polysaccharide biosynthesis protein PslH